MFEARGAAMPFARRGKAFAAMVYFVCYIFAVGASFADRGVRTIVFFFPGRGASFFLQKTHTVVATAPALDVVLVALYGPLDERLI